MHKQKRMLICSVCLSCFLLLGFLTTAGLSLYRGSPPFSALSGEAAYKHEGDWSYYRLSTTSAKFIQRADSELVPKGWSLISSTYAIGEKPRCWNAYWCEPWIIEFTDDPVVSSGPSDLVVRVYKSQPGWFIWMKEKMGFSSANHN